MIKISRLSKIKKSSIALGIFIIIALFDSSNGNTVYAQSGSTNITIYIQGSPKMYSSTFDLCGSIHLGSCPIEFAVTESFNQNALVSFTTNSLLLQPGEPATLTANINPAVPSASVQFVFNYNGYSYTYQYPLSSFPALGSSQLMSISIPINLLTAALGLPFLPVSLIFNLLVSTNLSGGLQGNGFSSSSTLYWSSVGSQSASLSFLGNVDTATLDFNSLISLQNWQISLVLSAPLVGSWQLFNQTVSNLQIRSTNTPVPLFTWHHLSLSTKYSRASGSGWYLSGTSATISIDNSVVNVNQNEREIFTGWIGTGSGSYSGSDSSATFAVNGPITETADWQTQYLVIIAQPEGGSVSPSAGSAWYNAGQQISFTAMPASSYEFKDWLVNGQVVSSSPNYLFTVQGPATIQAEFGPMQTSQIPVSTDSIVIATGILIAAFAIFLAFRRYKRVGIHKNGSEHTKTVLQN